VGLMRFGAHCSYNFDKGKGGARASTLDQSAGKGDWQPTGTFGSHPCFQRELLDRQLSFELEPGQTSKHMTTRPERRSRLTRSRLAVLVRFQEPCTSKQLRSLRGEMEGERGGRLYLLSKTRESIA
jgi:hypothetical protein